MKFKALFKFSLFIVCIDSVALEVGLKDPRVRITIPELPDINMEKHPLSDSKPHLRLMGSLDGYTASIITPTADTGMTSLECASSRINSLIKQYKLHEDQFTAMKSEDNNTFGIYFPIKLEDSAQLHAYILSSHAGSYCVEVHVSRLSQDIEEAMKWIRGFPNARVVSY